MEHLIRILNERDRRTLEWLRTRVGDASLEFAVKNIGGTAKPYISTVCRTLGVRPPTFAGPGRRVEGTATANQSLAAMKALLAAKAGSRSGSRSRLGSGG